MVVNKLLVGHLIFGRVVTAASRVFHGYTRFGNCTKHLSLRIRNMTSLQGTQKPLIAVCQMTATDDKEKNFATCAQLIGEARQRGAGAVFLPEGFDYIGSSREQTLSLAEPLQGDLIQRYNKLARDSRLWLFLGGFHEKGHNWAEDCRVYNSHVVIDDTGCTVSVYRKTHLFDISLQNGISLKESSFTLPGPALVPPVSTPAGKVGLAVCYDLRFPELSLALRQGGAEILTFPSAFTITTGQAHWEVLLRARAVENQCYVVAAAQTGKHNERRASYGHSLVVDPWGTVVAQCSEGTNLCYAEIDLPSLHRIRLEMPLESHRRSDLYGNISSLNIS